MIANYHWKTNFLVTVVVGGVDHELRCCLNDAFRGFYQRLYVEEEYRRPNLDAVEFGTIEARDITWLERPFSAKERLEILMSCNSDKALEPNSSLCFLAVKFVLLLGVVLSLFGGFYDTGNS